MLAVYVVRLPLPIRHTVRKNRGDSFPRFACLLTQCLFVFEYVCAIFVSKLSKMAQKQFSHLAIDQNPSFFAVK